MPDHSPASGADGLPSLPPQDKACIPQGDIDRSLACLPIFLSGCQQLLIVAGRSYCERLWCVMEIFVYLHMGGSLDRITIEIIAQQDTVEKDARQLLTAQFACFDAAKAQCFKVEDREKLLAVIEAAFGDFKEFNQCVRDVFAERTVASSTSRLPVARACLASGGAPEAASVVEVV